MKERHEKETALKAERDLLAKDAADQEAANQVINTSYVCSRVPGAGIASLMTMNSFSGLFA